MKLQNLKIKFDHQALSHRPFKICEIVDELKKCANRRWQDGSVFTNVLFLQMTQVPFPAPKSGSSQPPVIQSLGFQSLLLVPRNTACTCTTPKIQRHTSTYFKYAFLKHEMCRQTVKQEDQDVYKNVPCPCWLWR